jgi:hypothetical protein
MQSGNGDLPEGDWTGKPRLFTFVRRADVTGVSGTGRVLDGVIFHTGQVVVCWRGDLNRAAPGYSSLAVYPSWEAFLHVHIHSHPPDTAELLFADDKYEWVARPDVFGHPDDSLGDG